MKKRVTISFDWWYAIVEIEDSQETIKLMEEQLMFWSGGKYRIQREKGDIEKAYVKMLGQELINLSMEFNIEGIKSHFDDKEGWCDLRGKFWVELIDCQTWVFEEDDFDIEYNF